MNSYAIYAFVEEIGFVCSLEQATSPQEAVKNLETRVNNHLEDKIPMIALVFPSEEKMMQKMHELSVSNIVKL